MCSKTFAVATGLSRSRAWTIHALILLVLGGHVIDIVTFDERWPFSRYSMFNFIAKRSFGCMMIYGVTSDGREFGLRDQAFTEPFIPRALAVAFENLTGKVVAGQTHNTLEMAGGRERVAEVLRDCLRRYDARRQQKLHDGPELVAMRLYLVGWDLEPFARNTNTPERRELLADSSLGAAR